MPRQCSTITAMGVNESRAGPHIPGTTSVACSLNMIFAILQRPTRIGSCISSVGAAKTMSLSCWLLNPKAAIFFPSFMQSHEHEPFWEEAGLRLQRTHPPSGEKLLFGVGLMHHSLVSCSIRGGICDYSS